MSKGEVSSDSGIDWDAGLEHFITVAPPRMTIREYASITQQMAWTGYQEISTRQLAQYAKNYSWLYKKAQYLREHKPGLLTDAEIIYAMTMQKFLDEYERIDVKDMSGIVSQIIKLQELLMAYQPEADIGDNREILTRDMVIDIAARISSSEQDNLLAAAQDVMAEETPA